MRTFALALAFSGMLTVEQRDSGRGHFDRPTVAVSADARFIAFVTYAQLVQADTDIRGDLYVLDRLDERVTLESVDRDPQISTANGHPNISGDGRFLVYESGESIILKDRAHNTSRILATGRQPEISADGRIVVFTTGESADAGGVDLNGMREDIYALDLASGRASRISVDLRPLAESTSTSISPSVSGDGRYVAFAARPAGPAGRGPTSQVFVRDTVEHRSIAVSPGWAPSMSADGRYVAFVQRSGKLSQVYVFDLHSQRKTLVSRNADGDVGNGASTSPAISDDGRFVAFQSEASNLLDADDFNLLWDVFLFDRITGEVARVSGDPGTGWMEPSGGPAIDAKGAIVAFSSRHPTDAGDKRNDFDLYVASYGRPARDDSARSRAANSRIGARSGLFASARSR
jgi:Tol biopolymer transport system component